MTDTIAEDEDTTQDRKNQVGVDQVCFLLASFYCNRKWLKSLLGKSTQQSHPPVNSKNYSNDQHVKIETWAQQ